MPGAQKRQVSQIFFTVVPLKVSIPKLQDLGFEAFWGLFPGAVDELFVFLQAILKQPVLGIILSCATALLKQHHKIIIDWYQRGLVRIPTLPSGAEPN